MANGFYGLSNVNSGATPDEILNKLNGQPSIFSEPSPMSAEQRLNSLKGQPDIFRGVSAEQRLNSFKGQPDIYGSPNNQYGLNKSQIIQDGVTTPKPQYKPDFRLVNNNLPVVYQAPPVQPQQPQINRGSGTVIKPEMKGMGVPVQAPKPPVGVLGKGLGLAGSAAKRLAPWLAPAFALKTVYDVSQSPEYNPEDPTSNNMLRASSDYMNRGGIANTIRGLALGAGAGVNELTGFASAYETYRDRNEATPTTSNSNFTPTVTMMDRIKNGEDIQESMPREERQPQYGVNRSLGEIQQEAQQNNAIAEQKKTDDLYSDSYDIDGNRLTKEQVRPKEIISPLTGRKVIVDGPMLTYSSPEDAARQRKVDAADAKWREELSLRSDIYRLEDLVSKRRTPASALLAAHQRYANWQQGNQQGALAQQKLLADQQAEMVKAQQALGLQNLKFSNDKQMEAYKAQLKKQEIQDQRDYDAPHRESEIAYNLAKAKSLTGPQYEKMKQQGDNGEYEVLYDKRTGKILNQQNPNEAGIQYALQRYNETGNKAFLTKAQELSNIANNGNNAK